MRMTGSERGRGGAESREMLLPDAPGEVGLASKNAACDGPAKTALSNTVVDGGVIGMYRND